MASRASALYAAVSNKRDGCLQDSSENESPEKLVGHEEIVDSFVIQYENDELQQSVGRWVREESIKCTIEHQAFSLSCDLAPCNTPPPPPPPQGSFLCRRSSLLTGEVEGEGKEPNHTMAGNLVLCSTWNTLWDETCYKTFAKPAVDQSMKGGRFRVAWKRIHVRDSTNSLCSYCGYSFGKFILIVLITFFLILDKTGVSIL